METTSKGCTMRHYFPGNTFLLTIIAIAITLFLASCGPSRLEQKQSRIHVDMGIAYLKSSRYAPALRELIAAEKLTPKDPEIHYFTGVSYYGSGMKEDAVKEFKKAVVLNPDYSEAHNYLGVIYMEKGLYNHALDELNRALSNVLYESPAASLNNMGFIYYKKGDYKAALAKYEEAVKREPGTILLPLIEKNMGVTAIALNDIDKAVYHLERAVKIAPYVVEARYWLGMSYLKEGNKKKAIEELRAAVKIDPKSPFGIKAKDRLYTIIEKQ